MKKNELSAAHALINILRLVSVVLIGLVIYVGVLIWISDLEQPQPTYELPNYIISNDTVYLTKHGRN